MRYYVLESGSKGNSTIIVSQGHYLVIDNGLSHKKFKSYISQINVSLDDLKSVLITHRHSDHIGGIDIFDKSNLYATNLTFKYIDNKFDYDENHLLKPYYKYHINSFEVYIIPTSHDADGSIGFVIEADGEKLVYITDTGYIYDDAIDYLKGADYYIFESNHDVRMQLATGRPQYLIDRIMGDTGHLSNEDAALYLSEIISGNTKEIVLAHLSEEANSPEVALSTFNKIMSKRNINTSDINVRCAMQNKMICGGNVEKELCYD